MRDQHTNKKGYIAITSSLIITMLIMAIVFAVSIAGYFGRHNIMTSEFKDLSLSFAEGCMEKALLRYAEDPTFVGNEMIIINLYTCETLPIEILGDYKVFKSKTTFRGVRSNIKVVFDPSDMSIISWEELPNL